MRLSLVETGKVSPSLDFNLEKPSSSKLFEVVGPISGPSAAVMRNEGARHASGEWIFFKDRDCEARLDDVFHLLHHLRLFPEVKVVGGSYDNKAPNGLNRAYQWIQDKWVERGLTKRLSDDLICGAHLLGGALLVEKQAFVEVGGFSETIGWAGEEIDLVRRMNQRGWTSAFCCRLKVGHHNKMTFFSFIRRAWKQNFNRGRFDLKSRSSAEAPVSYFKDSGRNLPNVLLFLGVGVLGFTCGSLTKRVFQR